MRVDIPVRLKLLSGTSLGLVIEVFDDLGKVGADVLLEKHSMSSYEQ